jgi:hypothetical protein
MKRIIKELKESEFITVAQIDPVNNSKLIGYDLNTKDCDFCILKKIGRNKFGFISIRENRIIARFISDTPKEAISSALDAGRYLYQFDSIKELFEYILLNK